MTPPWKPAYSADAPTDFTCISCIMSKFGQSNGPPNDGADTSSPSYWNAFWLLSEPLMLKPLPAPMLLFVTWTPGASAGTSKNDVRDTAMFRDQLGIEVRARSAVHGVDHRRLTRHGQRLGDGADLQHLVELDRSPDFDANAFLPHGAESRERERHRVLTDRESSPGGTRRHCW